MDTAYWSGEFQKWWDSKGSKMKRPIYPPDLKEGYRLAAQREIAQNISPLHLIMVEKHLLKLEVLIRV